MSIISAIHLGDVAKVALFIDPANINQPLANRLTPLQYAAYTGQLQVCLWLIGEGAEVDVPLETCAITALYLALENGHYQVAELLCLCGASQEVVKQLAVSKGDLFIRDSLNQLNFKPHEFIFLCLHHGYKPRVIHLVLNYVAKHIASLGSEALQQWYKSSFNLLSLAIYLKQVQAIEALLTNESVKMDHPADLNLRTPLYWAIRVGASQLGRNLVAKGADINLAWAQLKVDGYETDAEVIIQNLDSELSAQYLSQLKEAMANPEVTVAELKGIRLLNQHDYIALSNALQAQTLDLNGLLTESLVHQDSRGLNFFLYFHSSLDFMASLAQHTHNLQDFKLNLQALFSLLGGEPQVLLAGNLAKALLTRHPIAYVLSQMVDLAHPHLAQTLYRAMGLGQNQVLVQLSGCFKKRDQVELGHYKALWQKIEHLARRDNDWSMRHLLSHVYLFKNLDLNQQQGIFSLSKRLPKKTSIQHSLPWPVLKHIIEFAGLNAAYALASLDRKWYSALKKNPDWPMLMLDLQYGPLLDIRDKLVDLASKLTPVSLLRQNNYLNIALKLLVALLLCAGASSLGVVIGISSMLYMIRCLNSNYCPNFAFYFGSGVGFTTLCILAGLCALFANGYGLGKCLPSSDFHDSAVVHKILRQLERLSECLNSMNIHHLNSDLRIKLKLIEVTNIIPIESTDLFRHRLEVLLLSLDDLLEIKYVSKIGEKPLRPITLWQVPKIKLNEHRADSSSTSVSKTPAPEETIIDIDVLQTESSSWQRKVSGSRTLNSLKFFNSVAEDEPGFNQQASIVEVNDEEKHEEYLSLLNELRFS